MSIFKKPIDGIPSFGWTPKTIKAYIQHKPLEIGDEMIVYNGQGGFHHYVRARVENPGLGPQRRVLLSASAAFGGSTFYRTGKNCYSPSGRSLMIPPTPALEPYLAQNGEVYFSPA